MTDRNVTRLKQYIVDDRPQRFQSYCRKHGLEVSEIKLKHGRNLLHYCCKHGHSYAMLRYLLREEVPMCQTDYKQNTPLHLGLKRVLGLEYDGLCHLASELYTELIIPLMEAGPTALGLQNSEGRTGRDLLGELVELRKVYRDSGNMTSDDSELDTTDEEDREFLKKFQRELEYEEYEYHSERGRYEEDFKNIFDERETFDDWADRIRQQYYEKKHAERNASFFSSHQQKKKGASDRSGNSDPASDRYAKRRAEMRKQMETQRLEEKSLRLLKLRMQYEKRYKELFDLEEKGILGYGDIPWPSIDRDVSDLSVLTDKMDLSQDVGKKYLRDQRVRWHPDKFMQRFGKFLLDVDRERIQARVTELSQSLNKLLKS